MFNQRPKVKTIVESIANPLITVDSKALQTMEVIIDKCETEVAWFGYVDRDGMNFHIRDIFLLDQEAHATTCEVNPDKLAEYANNMLLAENYSPEVCDELGKLKLWGHSHVDMNVSPSGQDQEQLKKFKDGNSYFIRVIGNKKGDLEFTIILFDMGIKFTDVPWIEKREHLIDKDALDKEIKAKVKEKKFRYTKGAINNGFKAWWEKDYATPWDKEYKTSTGISYITQTDYSDDEVTTNEIMALLETDDLQYLQSNIEMHNKIDYIKDSFDYMGTISSETIAEILNIIGAD